MIKIIVKIHIITNCEFFVMKKLRNVTICVVAIDVAPLIDKFCVLMLTNCSVSPKEK